MCSTPPKRLQHRPIPRARASNRASISMPGQGKRHLACVQADRHRLTRARPAGRRQSTAHADGWSASSAAPTEHVLCSNRTHVVVTQGLRIGLMTNRLPAYHRVKYVDNAVPRPLGAVLCRSCRSHRNLSQPPPGIWPALDRQSARPTRRQRLRQHRFWRRPAMRYRPRSRRCLAALVGSIRRSARRR